LYQHQQRSSQHVNQHIANINSLGAFGVCMTSLASALNGVCNIISIALLALNIFAMAYS